MLLLTKEIERTLPPLRSQDGKRPEEVKIMVKFFDPTGRWTWYVVEGEKQADGDWLFYGVVDGFEKEFGYFYLSEIKDAKKGLTGLRALPIERDRYFGNHTIADIKERSL